MCVIGGRRSAYLSVFTDAMRVFTLWNDCNALLHVVSQQHLQKHLIHSILRSQERPIAFRERPLRTCAGLRLCLLAISATTGSSRILCGSLALFNLKRNKKTEDTKAGGCQGCNISFTLISSIISLCMYSACSYCITAMLCEFIVSL